MPGKANRRRMKKKLRVRFCPKCRSTDIMMVAGGKIGIYECKKCGFRGSIFPEKNISLKKEKSNNKIKKEQTKNENNIS